MRITRLFLALGMAAPVALGLWSLQAHAQGRGLPPGKPDAALNLETREGVTAVHGQWRYSDVTVTEVAGVTADQKPTRTYDFTPHAGGTDFDDSGWDALDPTTLQTPRGGSKLCFGWYRLKITVPEKVGEFRTGGATAVFETTVNDYGEVWVDGKLPAAVGDTGGAVISGYNAPNRLVIARDVKPGQTISLAVFAANGPLSAAPDNWIMLRTARLEFYKK